MRRRKGELWRSSAQINSRPGHKNRRTKFLLRRRWYTAGWHSAQRTQSGGRGRPSSSSNRSRSVGEALGRPRANARGAIHSPNSSPPPARLKKIKISPTKFIPIYGNHSRRASNTKEFAKESKNGGVDLFDELLR